jgi:hypothetical protein
MGSARVAALLCQALGVAAIGATTAGYAALDPSSQPGALSPKALFAFGAAFFALLSVALVVRLQFDLLVRLPALILAGLVAYRSAALIPSFPIVLANAPLHLILSYIGVPLAAVAATLLLSSDVVADIRKRLGGGSPAV